MIVYVHRKFYSAYLLNFCIEFRLSATYTIFLYVNVCAWTCKTIQSIGRFQIFTFSVLLRIRKNVLVHFLKIYLSFFCLINYLYLIKINQLCSWMTSPIGRRSIVHQCAECCDPTSSPNCNGRLCNFSGTHFAIEMTNISVNKNYDCILFSPGFCRVCYGVHQDASSCPLTQCADDEVDI